VLVGYGFRAAPATMVATMVLAVVNGLSAGFYPVGFRLFTNAYLAHDAAQLAVAVAVTAGLIAVNWTASNLDGNLGIDLADRVSLYVSTRVAELVNRADGVDHFERPEYLRELDLVEQNGGMISGGPRQLLMTLQTVVRAGGVIVLFASVHPVLLLLPAVGLLPSFGEAQSVRIRQRAEERMAEQKRLGDHLFAIAATAAPAKEVRIFGLARELLARHEAIGRSVTRQTTRAAVVGAGAALLGWLFFIAAFVFVLRTVVRSALNGGVSPGDIVLAVVLAQQVRGVFEQVATQVGQLLTSARTADRLLWLEDVVNDRTGGELEPPQVLRDAITFDDVSFRYPSSEGLILDHIDLRIPAGTTLAVVGDNGAGKTTIVKLLTGMYEPTSGAITIDGVDLREMNLMLWRRRTSAGFQDHVAWELIAQETVGIGDLERIEDIDAVNTALLRASAAEVVNSFDEGLDTQLGRSFPGGRELSGGQWQKLALGRAMMRDTPLVVILDEPTASLDAATEHALFEKYTESARRSSDRNGTITVLISHRFSTVRTADLIAVVRDGRISELGTHDDLIERKGTYAELFELQARAYR
jgi:ATP-binding cassette subfamily B protein